MRILPTGRPERERRRTAKPDNPIQSPLGDRIRFGIRQWRRYDRLRTRAIRQSAHLAILETAHEVVSDHPAVIDEEAAGSA